MVYSGFGAQLVCSAVLQGSKGRILTHFGPSLAYFGPGRSKKLVGGGGGTGGALSEDFREIKLTLLRKTGALEGA